MKLAHKCSARGSLLILAAVLLSTFVLTTNRLHYGSPGSLSQLANDWTGDGDADTEDVESSPSDVFAWGPGTATSDPDDAAADVLDPSKQDKAFCSEHFPFLASKDLHLTNNIVYSRRCIKPIFHADIDRDAVANISSPLTTTTTTLNLQGDCSTIAPPPCETLELAVPSAYPPTQGQYAHLLFGVASTYSRLEASLPIFAHWLSNTGAQLVAVVADADVPGEDDGRTPDLDALQSTYRAYNMTATFLAPTTKTSLPRKDTPADAELSSPAAVEQLHFLMLRDMLRAATPKTQWLGVLDDDTFFPALHPLSTTLQQHDHTRSMWLGALADNWESNRVWGFMAYGGAGVFLSVPLAEQLEPYLEDCIRAGSIVSGDGMLKECVYARSNTRLTLVDGLYQHDIMGDPAGFFESGPRPLSIHHWKSWYHAPVARMAAVASLCGDCFLQRWRLGGDTVLSNGYSIAVYRDGVGALDLDRMEGTFDSADWRYHFVYGVFRPRLGRAEKKSYRLVGVEREGGRFKQVYVHRGREDEEEEERRIKEAEEKRGKGKGGKGRKGKGRKKVVKRRMDEVIELIWEV